MDALHDAVLVSHSLKRCTFGRWKRRLLVRRTSGDLAYVGSDGEVKGTIPADAIRCIRYGSPLNDPEPPYYANAYMIVIEQGPPIHTGNPATKLSYFVLSTYDETINWVEMFGGGGAGGVLASSLGNTASSVMTSSTSTPYEYQAFVCSINISTTCAKLSVTSDGFTVTTKATAATRRHVSFEEVLCIFECSFHEEETNSMAVITHSENFVVYFYDLELRAGFILQMKKRALAPCMFLDLQDRCSSLIDQQPSISDLRDRFVQFGKEIPVVMNTFYNQGLSAPYVVLVTLLHIATHGYNVQGVFRMSGLSTSITALRNAVDSSQDILFCAQLHPDDVHNATGLLKLYLRTLPHPMLSQRVHSAINSKDLTALRCAVKELGPHPAWANSVRYLFYTLHKIHVNTVTTGMDQGMTAHALATLFAAVLGGNTGGADNAMYAAYQSSFHHHSNTPPERGGSGGDNIVVMTMHSHMQPIEYLIAHYPEVWEDGAAVASPLEGLWATELSGRRQERQHSRHAFHPTPEKLRRGEDGELTGDVLF